MSKYILPKDFLFNLQHLAFQYENKTHAKLDDKPSNSAFIFFGAKNLKLRNKQLTFIAEWVKILEQSVASFSETDNAERLDAHFNCMKILVCICLFIKKNTSNKSVLNNLLDQALGLKYNPVDKKTRMACIITTQEFLETNQILKRTLCNKTSFRADMVRDLVEFIHQEGTTANPQPKKNQSLTQYIVPVTSRSMECAGLGLGYVLGDFYNHVTRTLPPQTSLAAICLGGVTIASFGGIWPALIVVAPPYLSRIAHSVYNVSFAFLLASAMRMLGTGIGTGVAITLDFSIHLVKKACEMILKLCKLQGEDVPPDGFVLWDQTLMINGNIVNPAELEYEKPLQMTIQDEGITIENCEENNSPHTLLDLNTLSVEDYTSSIANPDEESADYWSTWTGSSW